MPPKLFKINTRWKKAPVYTKRAPIISQTLCRGILGVTGVVGVVQHSISLGVSARHITPQIP